MSKKSADERNNKNFIKTKGLVLTGLIFGIALVLSIAEGLFPPIPFPVPGVKLGLSNIAVMYALFFLTKKQAYSIAILKALFVFSARGLIAGILSLSGGILSLSVMLLLLLIYKERVSYLIISVFGAVAHNIGQFFAISVIYKGIYLWAYIPVLILSGVAAGIVTATLLRVIIPAFKKAGLT